MKNYRIAPVLLLILVIIASGCHRSYRKELRERRAKMEIGPDNGLRGGMPGWRMRRMAEGMGHRPMMQGRGPGMNGMMPGRMNGMMPEMAGLDSAGPMPFGLGRRMMESIPNVTDSQKKQIEDLVKKHQEEMKELHEEMASKMQKIMSAQRSDIMNVMTDEQKKYLENAEKMK
jgi:gas vesicle protein